MKMLILYMSVSPLRPVFTTSQPAILLKQTPVKSSLRILDGSPFQPTCGSTWLAITGPLRVDYIQYTLSSGFAASEDNLCELKRKQANISQRRVVAETGREGEGSRREDFSLWTQLSRPTYPSQPQTYSLLSLNCEIHVVIIAIIHSIVAYHKDSAGFFWAVEISLILPLLLIN